MKKVTIFSTKICPYCMRAKNFFDRKNIPYETILVDERLQIYVSSTALELNILVIFQSGYGQLDN